ncbi:MAG: organic solvent tolerance protein OstA [Flavipsychrobacter sp.]|nr:organic solvent tolerance protein OstA [Flavipsychrobacter sp.]
MNLRGKFIPKFPSLCCFTMCMAIIFIFSITNKGYCQSEKPLNIDTTKQANDSFKVVTDTINISPDSLKKDGVSDSVKKGQLEERLGVKISKDALPAVITATAVDSAVLDMEHNLFYLYKNARVNYEDIQLDAGQVTYSQASSVITAAPYTAAKDSAGYKQTFTQGREKFTYDSMQYNFKSKRAIVRNVHSQYGEGFVFSEQVKRNPDQTIYGSRSIYTTCALDTPHFGIYAKKIKVIPNRVIVSGPCNIAFEGVPTPLYLPFGIFPSSTKQKSGFVLPTYTVEQQRGLGLLNGGYYLYLNDHVDVITQVNVYTKGSYALTGLSNYNTLYRYQGALRFSYAYNKTGEDFEPGAATSKDFMINWSHRSDGRAIPGQSFNASVEAGTSSYYSLNSYDANQILRNQYQSNISYAKNWQGKPFALTASALHNQNTTTKEINVTLPALNFNVAQINPFQSKKRVTQRWYDKITSSYNFDFLNRTTFYDSTFNLSKLSFDKFKTGFRHSIPVSAAYTVLRYVNLSFNANYNEYWVTERIYQQWNPTEGKLDSTINNGFYTSRDFNAGMSLSTRIYGMKLFRKGKLRGIRHVLTPSTGFNYRPDFAKAPFNYYYPTHLDSSTDVRTLTYISPYPTSIVGGPPSGEAGSVSLGINNNLQIKVRSAKDTVSGYKNITLIDGFGVSAAYNVAADSFHWSLIRMDFRTNIADKINVSSAATFDPYAFDYDAGRTIPRTMYEMGYGIARFTSANLALGTNFHSKPKGSGQNPSNSQEYGRLLRPSGYYDYADFNIPWSFNVSYQLTVTQSYNTRSKHDTFVLSHSFTLGGELQITDRWKARVNTGYNFDTKEISLTSIDLHRDLHCWEMHFQTFPFGPRKSFNFTLNVKSSILQDLKVMRRRDFRDAPN